MMKAIKNYSTRIEADVARIASKRLRTCLEPREIRLPTPTKWRIESTQVRVIIVLDVQQRLVTANVLKGHSWGLTAKRTTKYFNN